MEKIPQLTQGREGDDRRSLRKARANKLVCHPNGDGNGVSFGRLANHTVPVLAPHSTHDRKTLPEQIEPLIVNRDGFRSICIM
jgi:hypothetical protein